MTPPKVKKKSKARPTQLNWIMINDHPAVRHLSAAAFGVYARALIAHFHYSLNIETASDGELSRTARIPPASWMRCKGAVRAALSGSLADIVHEYQETCNRRHGLMALVNKGLETKREFLRRRALENAKAIEDFQGDMADRRRYGIISRPLTPAQRHVAQIRATRNKTPSPLTDK